MVVFLVVGKSDPIYELEVGPTSSRVAGDSTNENMRYLHQFTMFSSLDMINSTMWTNSST
jgi:hypothetical protein